MLKAQPSPHKTAQQTTQNRNIYKEQAPNILMIIKNNNTENENKQEPTYFYVVYSIREIREILKQAIKENKKLYNGKPTRAEQERGTKVLRFRLNKKYCNQLNPLTISQSQEVKK